MISIEHYKVFTDWLSISYSASNSPLTEVLAILSALSPPEELPKGANETCYKFSDVGTLWVTHKDTFHNFSFSGGLLASLRRLPQHRDLILALGSSPHNITRLDAAFDVPIPCPLIISNIRSVYPHGVASLCGHNRKLQYILSRDRKQDTGTVYFQDRKYKGNVNLRVYDKSYEVYSRCGEEIPTTTRYELTVKRGASLADYSNPSSIFWHYVPRELLNPPGDTLISSWSPTERVSYDAVEPVHKTDYETLRFLIQNSVSLSHLVGKCLAVNGGDKLLLREVRSALDNHEVIGATGGRGNSAETAR